jgi:tetratricopeptide (TPR) repeat protein
MKNNTYDLRIFLSSTFDEMIMRKARDAFRNEINARLNNIVGLLGGNAYIYDLQLGIPEGTDKLKTLEICFDKIKDSNCFVFILSEKYGKQNTRMFLLGEKAVPTQEIALSPYVETIREGIDKELYIIELEVLESEKKSDLKGLRLFFLDKKRESQSTYATKIKEEIKRKHESTDTIIEFETQDEIKEKFIAYFDEVMSKQSRQLNEDEQNHNLYISSMLRYYVENRNGISMLKEYQENDSDKVLVLYGNSGSGKSTLLADWLNRNHQEIQIIHYAIGLNGNSLREMLTELYQKYWNDMPHDLYHANEQKLAENFYLFLCECGKNRKTMILFDALNQLTMEREGINKYSWIPRFLPKNVKLIFSTTDRVDEHEFDIREMPGLNVMDIIKHILKCEGKEFETDTIEQALKESSFSQSDLPVLARLIYHEVVENFQYDNIKIRLIAHLNHHKDIKSLYDSYLQRLSMRFGEELVHKALTLVWCSKYGLTLNDIRDMISDARLDDLFYMLYQEFGRDRQERMKFGHKYLYDRVEVLFCENRDFVRSCRDLIIDQFEKRMDSERDNKDVLLEIAYQLYELRDGERMYKLLLNLENAFRIYQCDPYLVPKYAGILNKEKRPVSFLGLRIQRSKDLKKKLIHCWLKEKIHDRQRIFIATYCVMVAGKYNLALKHFKKMLRVYYSMEESEVIAHGESEVIAHMHKWVAKAFHGLGDYEAERNFLNKEADVLSKFNKKRYELNLQHSNLRDNFLENPNDETEKALLKETEGRYGRYAPETAAVYHDIASCYSQAEKFDKAISFFRKAIDIYEAIYGENHSETAESYHNLAGAFAQSNRHSDALIFFKKAEVILVDKYGSNHPESATLYNNLSGMYYLEGNYQMALKYGKKAYFIFKSHFGRSAPETKHAKNNVVIILRKIMENKYWDMSNLYR